MTYLWQKRQNYDGFSLDYSSDFEAMHIYFSIGRPIEEALFRTLRKVDLIVEGECLSPPEVIFFGPNMFVSIAIKDAIEKCEPNVHQFMPLNIVEGERPRFPDKEYYAFNCCNIVQGIVLDLTDRRDFRGVPILNTEDNAKITIDEKAVSGMAVWRDETFAPNMFISDALKRSIEVIDSEVSNFISCESN